MSLTISNYFADVSVTIKGNFIVKGAIVYAKNSFELDRIINNDPNSALLSSLVGNTGIYDGSITIENDLVFKCFGDSNAGSEEVPIITVEGTTIVNEYRHADDSQ